MVSTHASKVRWFVLALAILVVSAGTVRANDLILVGTGGVSIPTGEVGEDLIGPGVVFGGMLYVGLTNQVYVSGGGHLSVFGEGEIGGTAVTDVGVSFTFDGGFLFYLVDRLQSQFQPYVAATAGFGVLAWDYTPAGQLAFGVSSDSNNFFYFAPEAGIALGLNELIDFRAGFRFLVTIYGDNTNEGFGWDLGGGHYAEIYAGMGFSL